MALQELLRKASTAEADSRFYYYNGQGPAALLNEGLRDYLAAAPVCTRALGSQAASVGQTMWISTRGVTAPTHYDTHENVLTQVYGSKEIELWPHRDAAQLHPYSFFDARYRQARKDGDASIPPSFALNLTAGDALYIPAGYWHRVVATSTLSVSVSSHCYSIEDAASDLLAKLPFDSIDPATDALTLCLYLKRLLLHMSTAAAAAATATAAAALARDRSDQVAANRDHGQMHTLFSRFCGSGWEDGVSAALQRQIAAFVKRAADAFDRIADLAFRKTMSEKHGTIVVNAIASMLDTGYGDMLPEPSLDDFMQHC